MNIKKLCENVSPEMRPEVVTLARAVKALQKKIKEQLPVYNDLPLAQILTTTQGEKALKPNPAAQEFRATVREYAQALNNLHEILDKYSDKQNKTNVTSISEVGKSRWRLRSSERENLHIFQSKAE